MTARSCCSDAQIAGGIGGGTLVNETTKAAADHGRSRSRWLNQRTVHGGIIDGTHASDTGNKVTNAGTMEATAGGTLEIHDNVTNTGGTIAASDNSIVELFGATITGGTLESSGGGIIERRAAPARCPA